MARNEENKQPSANFKKLYDVAVEFLEYLAVERFYSKYTVKSYNYTLRSFVELITETYPNVEKWQDISDDMLRHVIRATKGKNTELKNRSRAHLVSVLKSFYKFLIRNKYVAENVMELIKLPKFGKKLPQYLTYEQITKLLTLPKNPTDKEIRLNAIIELLFSSGMRISELCNIRLSDIDINNQEVRVIGKGNKERIVPFGTYALVALNRWMEVRSHYNPECDYLFLNRFGNKLSVRAVQIELAKSGEALNLPIGLSPHKLRHSFATEMLAGGADLRVVQELLGHTTLGVTQVYLHLDENRLRKTYVKAHPLEVDDDFSHME